MDSRYKIIFIVGRRQTGKTTFGLKRLHEKQGKKLVLDTFDHPNYKAFKILAPEQIPQWRAGNYRVIQGDIVQNLISIWQHTTEATILLEDAAKYLGGNVPKEIKQGFIDHRNRRNSIIVMFHNFSDIPPYLAKMCDYIVMFATNDSLDRPQSGKFYNWDHIKKTQWRIRHLINSGAKPNWYNETIQMQ